MTEAIGRGESPPAVQVTQATGHAQALATASGPESQPRLLVTQAIGHALATGQSPATETAQAIGEPRAGGSRGRSGDWGYWLVVAGPSSLRLFCNDSDFRTRIRGQRGWSGSLPGGGSESLRLVSD